MQKMVVTDLDGTLFNSEHKLSNINLNTLLQLGNRGILRVIATGRSTFSAKKSLPPNLPLDYLVFSSGSGVEEWPSGKLLNSFNLSEEEVSRSFDLLAKKGLDIFVLDKVPDNHFCSYLQQNMHNPDFERRLVLYEEYAREIERSSFQPFESCQLIAISTGGKALSLYHEIKTELDDLNVIRSTSPIDGESLWIEVFPKQASKSNGIKFLADMYGIGSGHTMVIGNDYNDLDMLRWTKHPFVVDNAPDDLKKEFQVVGSNNQNGFSEAVGMWMEYLDMPQINTDF